MKSFSICNEHHNNTAVWNITYKFLVFILELHILSLYQTATGHWCQYKYMTYLTLGAYGGITGSITTIKVIRGNCFPFPSSSTPLSDIKTSGKVSQFIYLPLVIYQVCCTDNEDNLPLDCVSRSVTHTLSIWLANDLHGNLPTSLRTCSLILEISSEISWGSLPLFSKTLVTWKCLSQIMWCI